VQIYKSYKTKNKTTLTSTTGSKVICAYTSSVSDSAYITKINQ